MDPNKGLSSRLSSEQVALFWRKVRKGKPKECWEWQAYRIPKRGYGVTGFYKRTYLAHRVAWMLCKGDLADGVMVLHECDNPPCCNPRHLFLGTQIDNMRDMHRKNRANHPKGDRTGGRVASKLDWDDVEKIRTLHASGAFTHRALGKLFLISGTTVYRIVTYQLWNR